MTPSGPSVVVPAAVDEALLAAAAAAGAALPGGPWSCRPADGVPPAMPGPDAVAVAAALPGLGRLVLAVAAPLAAGIERRPSPAEAVADGLRPAFTAAAAALGVPAGALGDYGAGAVDADDEARGVLLFDGDVHRATVALVVTSGVPAVAEHEFSPLPGAGALPGTAAGRAVAGGPIELLHEVEMGVTVELGRTRMLVRDILDLSPGSVIELDRAAGAPIDVLVNGTLIARGEVVVIDEEFGIRITEVIGYESR